jgi:hypothetical protein
MHLGWQRNVTASVSIYPACLLSTTSGRHEPDLWQLLPLEKVHPRYAGAHEGGVSFGSVHRVAKVQIQNSDRR